MIDIDKLPSKENMLIYILCLSALLPVLYIFKLSDLCKMYKYTNVSQVTFLLPVLLPSIQ